MAMIFPNTLEETKQAPKEIRLPLIYVNSEGNRLGRPILPVKALEDMGYKMAVDSISTINVTFKAARDVLLNLEKTGSTGMDQAVFEPVRKQIEDTIGLEEYYRIERETTERE